MSIPKSLYQPLRKGQLNVGSGWRGYFAPFNQQAADSQSSSSVGPTIYDLEVLAKFIDPPVPTGWFDLGLIDGLKPTPGDKIGAIQTGYRGAVRAKYRAEISEKVSFKFREWSRMALTISSGSQVFNLLKSSAAASTTGPVSSSGNAAVPITSGGYVASGSVTGYVGQPTLYVPAGSGAAFPAGSYIVCDQDYNGTSFGYVGDAGANVFQGSVTDTDFIRKTSDYVACVKAVVTGQPAGDALILTGPFVGGGNSAYGTTPTTAPSYAAGSKVQLITGIARRSGGTYIKEWSAIFVCDTMDRNQILLYYPRLAPDTFAGFEETNLQNANALKEIGLNSSFEAMAFDDPEDGETVLSYWAFYPAAGAGLNIQI